MEICHAHDLILPTDKRNPCFSLYRSADHASIRVFYGLELLEVVPEDSGHPAFKMMVARLYNANVKLIALEEVFDVDRKTIRSWAAAIRSRDPELLSRVLLGRGVNVKRTRLSTNTWSAAGPSCEPKEDPITAPHWLWRSKTFWR